MFWDGDVNDRNADLKLLREHEDKFKEGVRWLRKMVPLTKKLGEKSRKD